MSSSSVYNTTNGPLIIDRAGHVLASRESADGVDVTSSPIAGHLAAGRLVDNTIAEPTKADAPKAKATNSPASKGA